MDSDKIRERMSRSYGPDAEREKSIDPEKFRKVFEVDKDEDVQKRKKRKVKKEEKERRKSPPHEAIFSEMMRGKGTDRGILGKRAKGVRVGSVRTTGHVDTPLSLEKGAAAGKGGEDLAPISLSSQQKRRRTAPSNSVRKKARRVSSQPARRESQDNGKGRAKRAPFPKARTQVAVKNRRGKGAPSRFSNRKEAFRATPTRPRREVKKSASTPKGAPSGAADELVDLKRGRRDREVRLERVRGGKALFQRDAHPPTREEERVKGKRGHFPEAAPATAAIPLPPPAEVLQKVTPADLPKYTQLPREVYELFELMAGVIVVEQMMGKNSTTVTVNMPNTAFEGAEIVLDQYSTAPMVYNIQFAGSPEAIPLFQAHLPLLTQAFQEGGYDFGVNLLKPVLQTGGKRHLIQRKSSPGDRGKREGEHRG